MQIYIDFETRSQCDLKVHGLHRYATHPSTFALMLAYGNRQVGRFHWMADLTNFNLENLCPIQQISDDLKRFVEDPLVEIHCHNASFEIAIWSEICFKRWGWPAIELDRWHCTAAKGSSANQPRGLDMLVQRLGLREEFQKDKKGKDLIKALSLPQKAQKVYIKTILDDEGKPVKDETDPKGRRNKKRVNTKSVQYLNEQGIETFKMPSDKSSADFFFDVNRELLDEFADYNIQDIIAEEAADAKLPPVTEYERRVWLLDRKINQRGIPVDLDLCRGALSVYSEEVEQAHNDISKVTDGRVTKCTQRQKLVDWINEKVNFGSSLRDEYVTEFLEKYEDNPILWDELAHPHLDQDAAVREVIEALTLRQLAGGTAVGKYKAALNYASDDWRVRDQLLYYGAATGRWTGKGIQPHNFKRSSTPDETFISALKTGDHSLVSFMAELERTTVFKLLKACLRGIICASRGKKLVVSDFAGIESRVLNWLCGNESKLDLFRKGEDTYIHAALPIYGVKFEDITEWNAKKKKFVIQKAHKSKRQIGKACVGPDTLILTDRGYVKIIDVKLEDRIWDGVEWINHGGVICQGFQLASSLDGLAITDDHVIFIGEERFESWLLKENTQLLRLATSSANCKLPELLLDKKADRLGLCVNVLVAPYQSQQSTILIADIVHDATVVPSLRLHISETAEQLSPCLIKTIENVGLTVYRQCCQDVSTGPMVTTVAGESKFMTNGKTIEVLFCSTYKPFQVGIIQNSKLTELITAETIRPEICVLSIESATRETVGLPRISTTIVDSWPSLNLGINTVPLSRETILSGVGWQEEKPAKKLLKLVYDITNAGPRTRYTVKTNSGNLIISNCELGLGYGMGATTFQTNALRAGNVIGLDFAAEVVAKWREAHKPVVDFWYRIEKAAKFVVRNKNGKHRPAKVNSLKVYWDPRGYLCIELPSGRVLYYFDAVIDKETGQIFYRDGGKMGKPENKGRINTYGGKLTENIVQAIARDLLVNSLFIIDSAGYDIVFHVHDESVTEVDEYDTTAKSVVHEAMQTVPDWSTGLPLVAETHETIRYTK